VTNILRALQQKSSDYDRHLADYLTKVLLFERQVEVLKGKLFEITDLQNNERDLPLFNTVFRAVDYSRYTYVSATDLYKFVEDNIPGVTKYSIKHY
jgi:hypothetical protein